MIVRHRKEEERTTSTAVPDKGHYGDSSEESVTSEEEEDMSRFDVLNMPEDWPGSQAEISIGSFVVVQDSYAGQKSSAGLSVCKVTSFDCVRCTYTIV